MLFYLKCAANNSSYGATRCRWHCISVDSFCSFGLETCSSWNESKYESESPSHWFNPSETYLYRKQLLTNFWFNPQTTNSFQLFLSHWNRYRYEAGMNLLEIFFYVIILLFRFKSWIMYNNFTFKRLMYTQEKFSCHYKCHHKYINQIIIIHYTYW